MRIAYAMLLVVVLGSCNESEFTSSTEASKGSQQKKDNEDANTATTTGVETIDPQVETGTSTASVKKKVLPDYAACSNLGTLGKSAYGACAVDSVIVVINDGTTAEMTCCPLTATDILSKKAGEVNLVRDGRCGANEVQTGMISASSGRGYCTKINTDKYQLGTAVASRYSGSYIPTALAKLVGAYNNSDACLCPENTVSLGGHSSGNNTCGEQCAELKPK